MALCAGKGYYNVHGTQNEKYSILSCPHFRDDSGLPVAAIIGIAVGGGVVLLTLLLCLCVCVFCWRRSHRKKAYVCQFVCMSVCLSSWFAFRMICLSGLSVHVCSCVCLSVCLFTCLSVCLSIRPFVHMSIPVCLFMCLSVCLSVCLFMCLSLSIQTPSILWSD